jgi:hypothetical protein
MPKALFFAGKFATKVESAAAIAIGIGFEE